MRDDPSHQAPIQRLLGRQSPPGEHQVAGPHRPDQPGQHVAVIGVGDPAVQLGHPEPRSVADHGHVGAQGDLHAAALTEAVDCGHNGFGRLAHVSNGSASMPSAEPNVNQLSSPPPPMSPPGAKTSAVPVMIRPARSGSDAYVVDRVLDAEVHRRRHRIARLGPVECAHPEGALPLEPQELRAQPIPLRRLRVLFPGNGFGHRDILARMVSANRSMGAR